MDVTFASLAKTSRTSNWNTSSPNQIEIQNVVLQPIVMPDREDPFEHAEEMPHERIIEHAELDDGEEYLDGSWMMPPKTVKAVDMLQVFIFKGWS